MSINCYIPGATRLWGLIEMGNEFLGRVCVELDGIGGDKHRKFGSARGMINCGHEKSSRTHLVMVEVSGLG